MGSHYIDRIHLGVAHYAAKNNWHLSNLFGIEPNLIQSREFDGIIAALRTDDELSETIIRQCIPTVDLSIDMQHLKMPHLTGDNLAMGHAAAVHFLERGFKHFIWFSEKNDAAAQQRLRGFQTQLQDHGFDCVQLIVDAAFPNGRPSWKDLQSWILQAIHPVTRPCAVYAYNDIQAVNLIDACVAGHIRLPDEMAVLGTDNHPLICPTAAVPLSSINHDLEELGRRAAEELNLMMHGGPMEHKIIEIPHRGMTVRQSSDLFAINDTHVALALRFIHANFHRSISVTDIVNAVGISRRSLERRFQNGLQQSIHRTLNQRRLENACLMLRESSFPIADIAAASGFNTSEYLHRVFLTQRGMTPRTYRMKYRPTMIGDLPA